MLDDTISRWQADPPDQVPLQPPPMPGWPTSLLRGAIGRCPCCGQTRLFRGYIKVEPECAACGTPLGLVRADDAPPYFTIFIVAHVVIGLMLVVERAYQPPIWVHAVIWIPLTVIMALALLRPVKGATVGLMLKLGMFKSPSDG